MNMETKAVYLGVDPELADLKDKFDLINIPRWINTKVVLDSDGDVVAKEGYWYVGPVASCDAVKDALNQQIALMNQLAQAQSGAAQNQVNWQNQFAQQGFGAQQQQIAFQNKMMQDAISRQMGILQPGLNTAQSLLSGKVGFDPQMLAQLNAQTIDQTGNQFDQGLSATKLALARRGESGQMPVSGGFGRAFGSLEAARSSTLSQGLRDNGLQNLMAALANRNTGLNFIGGAGNMINPGQFFGPGAAGTFGAAISGAGGNPGVFNPAPFLANGASAFDNRVKLKMQPGFGQQLLQGVIGAGIGAATGGLGSLIGGLGSMGLNMATNGFGTGGFGNGGPGYGSGAGGSVNPQLSSLLANPNAFYPSR